MDHNLPARMSIQLTPLHWAAFYLIPEKFDFFISPANELQIIEVFDRHITDQEKSNAAWN